jgi:hypothetical protein
MAMRIRTEVTSKGSSRSRKRTLLKSVVETTYSPRREDEGQEADKDGYSGNAYDVGGVTTMGSFFFPGVE